MVCASCASRAVEDQAYTTYAVPVAAWYARHGLQLPALPPITPLQRMPRLPSGVGMLGYVERMSGSGIPVRIAVSQGLPPEVLLVVLAHELGHLWLDRHGVRLGEHLIEGTCDWLAHALASTSTAEELQWQARRIERRDDPVYGRGFKAVTRAAAGDGPDKLPAILHRLH